MTARGKGESDDLKQTEKQQHWRMAPELQKKHQEEEGSHDNLKSTKLLSLRRSAKFNTFDGVGEWHGHCCKRYIRHNMSKRMAGSNRRKEQQELLVHGLPSQKHAQFNWKSISLN